MAIAIFPFRAVTIHHWAVSQVGRPPIGTFYNILWQLATTGAMVFLFKKITEIAWGAAIARVNS